MATNLQIYESQVISFLQSCTIVFSPIATQENNNLLNAGVAVDETDPVTWKYYLNLSGQYHSTDTVMVIQSLDARSFEQMIDITGNGTTIVTLANNALELNLSVIPSGASISFYGTTPGGTTQTPLIVGYDTSNNPITTITTVGIYSLAGAGLQNVQMVVSGMWSGTITGTLTSTAVNFTTDMLAVSPKTKAAYAIGSSYYTALCQTYPTQVDLIKSILYPVDIETAITSPDFTLLGWGEGYLESTEEEAIIYELNKFIAYATTSWYFSFLTYEAYYAWAFWGVLWQSLPGAIFAARLKYLHTSYVHSFHIWAYLESNGISDYSDILNRQQSLFLYRNINYLIENRGTQSNLVVLVNNLLDTISVGLVGKTIYMDTSIGVAENNIVAQTISVTANGITTVNNLASGVKFGVDLDTIPDGASVEFYGVDSFGNANLLSLTNQITNAPTTTFTTAGFYWLDPNGLSSINVVVSGTWTETLLIYMYGEPSTDSASCQWVPEFVSKIVPTNNSQSLTIIAPESMTQINGELVNAGFEVNSTTPYILEQQAIIGNTNLNILPTKLVEIQKLGIDQKYGSVMIDFILDTLVSMIVTGRYTPQMTILDPTTNTQISLGGQDALALYYYAVHRSGMEQPIDLPVLYTPSCAFRYDLSTSVFPELFEYNGYFYPTRSYVDVGVMTAGISYPASPVDNGEDFSALVSNLFLVLIQNIRYSRTEGTYISLEMFLSYMKKYVLQTEPYTFTLSEHSDYVSWAANLQLTSLFTQLDASNDYQIAYSNLATAISSALVPFDQSAVFSYFGYTPESADIVYDRLKTLFEQLCSYNIAFLDTNRVNTWWFLQERILMWVDGINDQSQIAFNPVTGLSAFTSADTVSVTIDMLDQEAVVSLSDSTTQNLVENLMEAIGPQSDILEIPNRSSLSARRPAVTTDTIRIPNHLKIRTFFVSTTSNM